MTRAELDRRMLGLLTRADELAAGFLALDSDLRALARDLYRDPADTRDPGEQFLHPEDAADA